MAVVITATAIAFGTLEVTLREKGGEMRTRNKAHIIRRVPKDAVGTRLVMTIVDDDGAAIDLSSATGSLYFHASTQDGNSVTYQGAASFTNGGIDGLVEFALTSTEVDTVRTLRCEFEVQGYSGGNLITELFYLQVIERAAVAP